ncbi:MAG: hypothetical protein C0436_00160 [Alphaproteobacteria bacterium]|nr:hypothetical protein [Alphaproteobacteria bacterium]
MDKKEALDRLAAIEKGAAELRKIIDTPEVDYSAWIGKYGFVSDDNLACPDDGVTMKLDSYDSGAQLPFCVGEGCFWRYFRPATLTELGFPELDPERDYVDWSKVPIPYKYVAVQPSGSVFQFTDMPNNGDNEEWWFNPAGAEKPAVPVENCAIIGPLPTWRESLRMRPEAAK